MICHVWLACDLEKCDKRNSFILLEVQSLCLGFSGIFHSFLNLKFSLDHVTFTHVISIIYLDLKIVLSISVELYCALYGYKHAWPTTSSCNKADVTTPLHVSDKAVI